MSRSRLRTPASRVYSSMIAVIAATGLLIAAIALVRRAREADYDFAAGYNALAPLTGG